MKNNTFYQFDYVPNKLAYVFSIKKNEIKFLAFPNKQTAIFHSSNTKKDFKPLKQCFNASPELKETIKNALKNEL